MFLNNQKKQKYNKIMIPKIPELRDFDFELLSLNNKNTPEFSYGSDHFSNDKLQNRTDYVDQKESPILISRSLKPKPGNFQISFESDFLDEHLKTLVKKVKNLVELSLKNQNIMDLNLDDRYATGLQSNSKDLNIIDNELLAPQLRKQFIKDLENEEKLLDFLKLISKEFSLQITKELVFFAYLAWEKYIQIRNPFISQGELLSMATKYSRSLTAQFLDKSGISFLNLKEIDSHQLVSEEQIDQNVEEFMQFYCSTIFFIVEGYFQNPFAEQQEDGKRERQFPSLGWQDFCSSSNDEDQERSLPMKRAKMQ